MEPRQKHTKHTPQIHTNTHPPTHIAGNKETVLQEPSSTIIKHHPREIYYITITGPMWATLEGGGGEGGWYLKGHRDLYKVLPKTPQPHTTPTTSHTRDGLA